MKTKEIFFAKATRSAYYVLVLPYLFLATLGSIILYWKTGVDGIISMWPAILGFCIIGFFTPRSGGPCHAKPYKILIDIKNNSRNITSFSRDQFVKIFWPAEMQGGYIQTLKSITTSNFGAG